MRTLFREISTRHWRKAPLRSALVVLGIALGVALYVATGAASNSMFAAFDDFTERVSSRADLSVTSTGNGLPNELVGQLSEVPGVAHVAASVEFSAQAPDLNQPLLILGVDLLGDLHFLPYTNPGGEEASTVLEDPLAFVNDPAAILVTAGFAKAHSLREGDVLRLLSAEGTKEFRVRGLLDDTGPGAALGQQVAIMFLDAAQVAFAKGQMADRIDVAVEPGERVSVVKRRLELFLGAGHRVERPAHLGAELRKIAAPLRNALWLSGLLTLIVGGFLVYNAVGVAVAQRRQEIGLLRTFGVTRGAVTWLFAGEACLLAVPGVLLGLVLALGLARFSAEQTLATIDQLYLAMPKRVPSLSPSLVLQGVAAGLATALLAAFVPARKGAWTEPASVLRGTAEAARLRPRAWLFGLGILCTAAAFAPGLEGSTVGAAVGVVALVVGPGLATPVLILGIQRLLKGPVNWWFGVPARLGLDYVSQTLGRSSVNVLALMVAVGMSVAVGGWLASFEQSIVRWVDQVGVADLTVTQGSPLMDRKQVPFAGALLEKLDEVAELPGVRAVQRFRMVDQQVGGQTISLVATDLSVFQTESGRQGKGWTVLDGDPLRADVPGAKPSALLSGNAAERLGLAAGDTLVLQGPAGALEVAVQAVIVDYTSELGAIFVDREAYRSVWHDDAVDALLVYVQEGATNAKVVEHIRSRLGGEGEGVFVTSSAALRRQLITTLRSTFSYSKSVEVVTLVVALLGIMGTMAAAIIDRSRELAVLRAVGATVRQVVATLIAEAGFLGLCAAVLGVAVGTLQCQLFLSTFMVQETGIRLVFAFPWAPALRIAGLVVITSALAGGIAALRTSRVDLAVSLRS